MAVENMEGWQHQFDECLIQVDGVLVEIAGLPDSSRIQAGDKEVDGYTQNGNKGVTRAESVDGSHQEVHTFDGLTLQIPTENLRQCTQTIPEAVAECLSGYQYCVLQMYQSEEQRQKVVAHVAQRSDWTRPRYEYEEECMGIGAGGQLAWLSEDRALSADHALQPHMQCMTNIVDDIGYFAQDFFSFRGPMYMALPMLRSWPSGGSEGSNEYDDEQAWLDFIQHRKFCVMLVVDGAGTLELHPKVEDFASHVKLPVRAGMLLIFRHDLFHYEYTPSGKDVMMQASLLEQPAMLAPEIIKGSEKDIKEIIGASGVAIPQSRQTHVLSFAAMYGGNTNSFEQAITMYVCQTDCGVKIPLSRWDNEPFYEFVPDGGYGITPGKSAINHSSFLVNEQFEGFDHDIFGFTYEEGEQLLQCTRMHIEGAYNCLTNYGYTKETLRGANLGMYFAGSRREMERMFVFRNMGKRFQGLWQEEQIIAWLFGTVGPTVHTDTACSASLVAINSAYNDLCRVRDGQDHHFLRGDIMRRALIGAGQYFFDPMVYVGLTAAHMLGSKGRSLTYDMSACGFAKGEGCKCALLGEEDSLDMSLEQYATMLGGAINQDGRSASLTAPSGPAQTQVIRASLRTTGRRREDVSITETHGTGTALGDPIEVGSMRAAMIGRNTSLPLMYTAGKSMTSHLEVCAGLAGFIKMALSISGAICTPNCHLRELNSNIDMEGYPAIWSDVVVDLGFELLHSGQSGFGFGGTNSRADLWASVKRGPRRVAPVIQVGGQAAAGLSNLKHYQKLRGDLLYDLCSNHFDGQASLDVGDPNQCVYIVGSWTDFSEYEEMQQTVDGYLHFVKLDHSQEAQFYMVLDNDPEQMLYPMSHQGQPEDRIGGPDGDAQGRKWNIEGSESKVLPYTVYRIMFTWDYGVRQMLWAQVTADMREGFTKEERDLFENCQRQDSDCETVYINDETERSDASTADS